MSFAEKTGNPDELRHWRGDVEADYIYTSGIAGDRFFKELRDTGTILGSWCDTCQEVTLPPRLHCENCLAKTADWREAPDKGRVEAFTVATVDEGGRPLEEPVVWALVNIQGTRGGFVHRLLVPPGEAVIGMTVRAVLKEPSERKGSITDILGFEAE
jgi:uncharacterized OB-fold protein